MRIRTLTKSFALIALAASAAVFSPSLLAQSYPSKNVNIVVPYPAGGASDFAARVLAKEMPGLLKTSMTVDNVVGVAGALGTSKVINSAPDGYNLLISSPLEMILTPLAISAAKYKPEDLRPAAFLGYTSVMLVTRKDLGVNSLEELNALAKKSTAKPLSYCTPGLGSLYHLMGEKLNMLAGTQNLHVPYNGFPQCVTNLVGSQIDFAFLPIAASFPGFVDSGGMKIIAVAATAPAVRFPKAPLMKSSKGFEEFSFSVWQGIHVSAKTPDDIASIINKATYAALAMPDTKKTIEATGAVVFDPMTIQQMNAMHAREIAMYQAIAKSINLQQQ
jgi:tripartite-type tricarboxylate transporter receptor subunit TctC